MTIYIVYIILTGIICVILCLYIQDDLINARYQKIPESKRFEDYTKSERIFRKLSSKESILSWFFFSVWILIITISPAVYEFPRMPIASAAEEWGERPLQSWMYIQEIDSKRIHKEKLPKFGTFHSLGQFRITKKVHTGPISLTRTFKIYDEIQGKEIKFRIHLKGDDWSQLLLEIYNLNHSIKYDHNFVLNAFKDEFNDLDTPFDQFPEAAEKLANEWLKKHNINSVHASLDKKRRHTWIY